MARDAGPARTAVLCLALIAAASAALAAGGPVQEAHAQDLILEPLGSLQDVSGNSRELDGASGVDVFTIGDSVYAVVAGHNDHGIQIVGLSNPGQPQPAGRLGDGSAGHLRLASPFGVEVFERGGSTYAAVVGEEDAVQVVDISDPAAPTYVRSLPDTSDLLLKDPFRAAVFERDNRTYLAVPSTVNDGVQLVDVTDPDRPAAAGKVEDNNNRLLDGATGVDIFERSNRIYAVVASSVDDGLQLLDFTDPDSPTEYSRIGELYDTPDARELDGAHDVVVFWRDGKPYAAVTGYSDDGLQLVDLSNLLRPVPVGRLPDTDDLRLRAPTGIDAFRIGAYSYVAVASDEDALQIVDVSDPHSPAGAGKLADGGDLLLWDTNDVKVFKQDGSIYAVVTSFRDDGIQVVRISHPDGSPPELKSAALDWGTRILEITFDEAIDVSETRLSRMSVPVIGGSSISLAGAAVRGGDSATVSMTLTKSQTDQIVRLDSPRIRVDGGAVSDLAGNTRSSTVFGSISVTGSDTEKPVITLVGDRSVAVELGGTYTEQGASVSDNDPAYAATAATVGGDAVDTGTVGTYTVTYTAPADDAGNAPDPVSRTVTVRDTTPPAFVSASLEWSTRILAITFDEAIDVSETDLSRIYVSDAGQADTVVLTVAELDRNARDTSTVSMTLTHVHESMITQMATPQLDIAAGAVKDTEGNAVDASPDGPISVTNADTTPPRLVSAAYDEATGILTAVFDEVIDVSRTDLDRVYIDDDNGNASGLSIDLTAPDSDTLTFQLGDLVHDLSGFVNPVLVVDDRGGIWDVAGNHASFQSVPITVIPATPEPPPNPTPRPACAPPGSGHWDVRDSCALASDVSVPAGITVHAPATLVIPAGVTLDVDFERHGLLVKQGAGLLIQHGGGMK